MAGTYNRTQELEDFTHNLIRGDLCVAAVHSALGSGLSGRHVSVMVSRRSIMPLSVQKCCSRVEALASGSCTIFETIEETGGNVF